MGSPISRPANNASMICPSVYCLRAVMASPQQPADHVGSAQDQADDGERDQ